SNVFVSIVMAIYLVIDIINLSGKKVIAPYWLNMLKFISTVGITLTFIVFGLVLTPQMVANGYGEYVTAVSSICMHMVAPVLTILDWCLFDCNITHKRWSFTYGAFFPILYFIFANVCVMLGADFGTHGTFQKFPYFFLDYDTLGWFNIGDGKIGVFYWIVVMIAFVAGLGVLLLYINKKAMSHRELIRKKNGN
ncbi:MAG: hypothetical protein RR291_05650, partial [Clostridia bacterium]